MLTRRGLGVAAGVAAAIGLSACASQETRYAVLSFFFDGVPAPGSAPPVGYVVEPVSLPKLEPVPAVPIESRRLIPHTPYKENRCEGCHDATSGQLLRPIEQGLCLSCHAKIVEGFHHVHGPVAVNDCTVCHHYHAAPQPNLLLAGVLETCLGCHDRSDLSPTAHPPDSQQDCTLCHLPHGGSDRYFLKGSTP